jgi:hypothetical protein
MGVKWQAQVMSIIIGTSPVNYTRSPLAKDHEAPRRIEERDKGKSSCPAIIRKLVVLPQAEARRGR